MGPNAPDLMTSTGFRAPFYSPLLGAVLPSWTSHAEVDPRLVDGTELFSEERIHVHRARLRRRQEFAAGRQLARQLLGLLGVPSSEPLLNGAAGAPQWPVGVVGSISHTATRVVVAVARDRPGRLLGVDIESDAPLRPQLLEQVCVDRELRWLSTLPRPEAGRAAKLLFSAKESVYKAQYPRTGRPLDFSDVHIHFAREDRTFEAQPTRGTWPAVFGPVLHGRYAVQAGFVVTAIAH